MPLIYVPRSKKLEIPSVEHHFSHFIWGSLPYCPVWRQPINYVEFWTLGLVQLVTLFNVWNWHIKPCMQKHYLQHYLPDYSIMRSSRYKASTARWIATRSPLVITSHRQRAFGTCAIMCWTRNIIVRSFKAATPFHTTKTHQAFSKDK